MTSAGSNHPHRDCTGARLVDMAHVGLGTPLLKLPLLAATAAGIHAGFTPPRPPPAVEERKTFAETKGTEVLPTVGSWGLVPFKVSVLIIVSAEDLTVEH